MSDVANVQSIQALADLRAALANFAALATKSLDECDLELRRAMQWVTQEQPLYWRREVQKSHDAVAFARNDLERAQAATFEGQRPTCLQQKKALEAAKAKLRRAEEKVELVRQAAAKIQKQSSEYASRMSQVKDLLTADVPVAMALLSRMVTALEGYAAIEAPIFTRPAATGAATGPTAVAAQAPAAEEPKDEADSAAAKSETDDDPAGGKQDAADKAEQSNVETASRRLQ
jgi:hypothetical protein